MLHRYQCPRPAEGGAQRHFKRNLFIRRPLRLTAQAGKGFEDFCRWRARVPRPQTDTGIEGGKGNGFVPRQEHAIGKYGSHEKPRLK